MNRKLDSRYSYPALFNGTGHCKVKRRAWTPRGPVTYYDSSRYMPHVGTKQQAKALRKTA